MVQVALVRLRRTLRLQLRDALGHELVEDRLGQLREARLPRRRSPREAGRERHRTTE
eukprot:CAMPEP_0204087552 /NCGR_PEP_ID=MMETSP0360-20130528/184880_1 /ASSEMBLY_ACC=CAM_ASM_000342 /TAXON_ID=268821 /ORGANISM="Scrippsiella Hangoei, Strain SHTV-5" /LENGTH=56 /DNA_ID=CAMNT_0051036705 /DNA_START=214 /DNA_END=381 /DNA_ORIENTATION=-